MKKLYIVALFITSVLGMSPVIGFSQICDSITPVFNVDLSGNPNGTWTSPGISRKGLCCGDAGPDKCIEFIVTLDSTATGISFDIVSGALPGGSLFYQVDCGPTEHVGQFICVSGAGPHYITFCKPGNNVNVYQISSSPQPSIGGVQWVSQACTGQLVANGLVDSTITWTSVPYNTLYNSFLSSTSGKDTVIITPNGAALPPYVTYQVCGTINSACDPLFFCDTIHVNFVNNLVVNITPKNKVICYGMPNVTVTANPSGGRTPYKYSWSTGATTQSISVSAGTYVVQLTDSMHCSTANDTVIVYGVPSQITVNAGTDQLFCTGQQSINLNGNVTTATGGQWSGGNGTFSPNDTILNSIYTPSAPEISAGSVMLTLTTTGNQGCPAVSDIVNITISPSPSPLITGPTSMCALASGTYTAPFVSNITYSWSTIGGSITGSATSNSVTVYWTNAGNNSVTLTETNADGCDSTVSLAVTINPLPAPVINGPISTCTTISSGYSIASPKAGDAYNWTVTGGTITGVSNASNVNVFWSNAGSASISVTESTSFGCDSSISISVTVYTMPSPVISGSANTCEGQTFTYSTPFVSGNIYNWNVTGGSVISASNNAITVQWPNAGFGSLSVTESNASLCDSTVSINITIGPQPAPVINGPSSTCTTTTSGYSIASPKAGDAYNWTVTGGTITGVSNASTINVLWSNAGNASLSVTESNSFGCDSSISIPFTVHTMPSPVISGPANTCEGQTFTYSTPFVSGNIYNWNVSGGSVISTNNNSINVQWLAAGTGSVSVTESNTSTCDSTVSILITIGPQPAPVINGPSSVCTTTYSDYSIASPKAGDAYNWTVTGGTITGVSNASTVNVFWSNAGSASISVTESNSFGCDSSISIPVTVYIMPSPVISGPANTCEGQTFTYSTPFVSGNIYSWNVTGGSVILTNNDSINVQWLAAGTGSVSVTESNTSACDSTVSILITIGPQPAPVINGPASTCTTTYSDYSIASPNAGDSYNWTVTGGTITGVSNASTVNVFWSNAGNASVSVTESNSFGCDSTISFPVNVLTMPSPVINGPANVCEWQTFTYSTNAVVGNIYNWNVTGGYVVTTNNNEITIQWLNAGFGSLSVTESNASLCDSTVLINIIIGPQPAPVINGVTAVCTYSSSSYNVMNYISGNSYSWQVTGGTLTGASTGSSINVLWTNPGTAVISVTESNSFGCDSTNTLLVSVMGKPMPGINGRPNACIYDTAIYHVTSFNQNDYYNWKVSGGSMIVFNASDSIQVLWDSSGRGEISVQQITQAGCDSAITLRVMVNQMPSPNIVGPSTVCQKQDFTYHSGMVISDTYKWTSSGGNISGPDTTNVVTLSLPSAGSATIFLVETTPQGCSAAAAEQIEVDSSPNPFIDGGSLGCISDHQSTYSTASIPGTAYQWSLTGGIISSGNETITISVQWVTPGTQSITLTETNPGNGCNNTVIMPVLVDSLAMPVIKAPDLNGCAPYNTTFTGNVFNPDYHYIWNFGDGTESTVMDPSHNYTVAGVYPVELIATNNTGCADTIISQVIIYPSPHAAFEMSYVADIYYAGITRLLLKNLSYGASNYLWNFGDGDTSTFFEPSYQYNNAGNYTITLTVTNQYGCTDVARRMLDVKLPENLYIPNAFTPNGDINSSFYVVTKNITQLHIDIFNRWGEQIYTSDNPAFQWDGSYKGLPVQEGVYVYLLRASGSEGTLFTKEGTVTVLR